MSARVLIVNGSADRRRTSREILDHAGYSVAEVLSLDAATSMARRDPPLAVIVEAPSDPALTVRFAERFRRHPATGEVPILVLGNQPDDVCFGDLFTAASCIPEPCSAQTLLRELAFLTKPQPKLSLPVGAR